MDSLLFILNRVQHLGHIRTIKEIPKTGIVAAHTNTRDDADLATAVFLAGNVLRLFHQEGTKATMLELARVTAMHRDSGAVDMQLVHDTGLLTCELRMEGVCCAALAELQETDQDVLFGVFIGEEGLPAAVGGVVAAHKLDL